MFQHDPNLDYAVPYGMAADISTPREMLDAIVGDRQQATVHLWAPAGNYLNPKTGGVDKFPRFFAGERVRDAILDAACGVPDVYFLASEFGGRTGDGWKTLDNLSALNAICLDLDWHTADGGTNIPPRTGLVSLINDFTWGLQHQRQPWPFCVVFSGRGLQIWWRIERAGPEMIPVWQSVARRLGKIAAAHFPGADVDAASYNPTQHMRLPGCPNSKTGFAPFGQIIDATQFYRLADMDAALPREKGEAPRAAVPAGRVEVPESGYAETNEQGQRNIAGFYRKAEMDVALALRTAFAAEIAAGRGVPEGMRNNALWALVMAAAKHRRASELAELVKGYAAEFAPDFLKNGEAMKNMKPTLWRAVETETRLARHFAGEDVRDASGEPLSLKAMDVRYRPGRRKLRELIEDAFEAAPELEDRMQVLYSDAEWAARKARAVTPEAKKAYNEAYRQKQAEQAGKTYTRRADSHQQNEVWKFYGLAERTYKRRKAKGTLPAILPEYRARAIALGLVEADPVAQIVKDAGGVAPAQEVAEEARNAGPELAGGEMDDEEAAYWEALRPTGDFSGDRY